MSKIKHWDNRTQQWVIDGASNAANIELSNPGYVDENGESISVDLGFTKLDNRLFKAEKNIAWIYQNGAKGGGGGGGGGGGDYTTYTIDIEEGTRVYTSSNSVTIHITINGGSVKKNFNVVIQDESGNTKGNYVVTSLTRTELIINNLSNSISRLTINANSGQNYATPVTLTVVAGAIKLTLTSVPNSTIYPLNPVGAVVLTASNSTDSDLNIVVLCNGELLDSFELAQAKETQFRVDSIVSFLNEKKNTAIGETFTFEIYAVGVLNDNLLQSESVVFNCTIVQPNTLYILTYDVNKNVPTNNIDLTSLNKFVYGNSIQFSYQLTYSRVAYSYYDINYTVTPCYFENGELIENTAKEVTGTISRVIKDIKQLFLFNTSSLPDDTIYNTDINSYKFVKVTLTAVSVDSSAIRDTKVLYFTLSEATTKYITATNFNNSLFAYFSPVMGVPVGNITEWMYDNRNARFQYSNLGIIQQRYVNMTGHNLSGFMHQTDMLGMHLSGKSWADLELILFSGDANDVNLLNGNGWTLSFTFRADSNVDSTDVIASLGKYSNEGVLQAGIEIQAGKIIYAVQTTQYSFNITKGDLTTVDIVGQRYIGPGDTNPEHWFIKTYVNGTLSMITSHTSSLMFNTDNSGTYGWYFEDYLHIGGRVIDNEIYDACSVHVYDVKGYSTALSDNEIILNYISANIYSLLEPNSYPDMSLLNSLLLSNFILIGTDGNYHSLLFDTVDETEYKDANSLLNSLVSALAESRIPYPIVVINQLTSDSNFLGITESKFNEDLKETVMASRFPINIDYYTMGNTAPVRIENTVGTGMSIGILGTSSLRYNSKNYEIYMGQDDDNKDVLVQMREDWLPENRYTLKADVMDSSHVNNILVGSIVNGLVTTEDASGNTVRVVPMDNTPPMEKSGYQYASKVKHTSEGYPCILFINFKATGSNTNNCRCMGIYNFNLGRYAYYNLGLKLLNGVTYTTENENYPKLVASYTEETEVETGSPVYSMEVQENSAIAMFDQDDPDILREGVFEFPYDSDGQGERNLGTLLNFLAAFGFNIETDKKVYRQNDWQTPKLKKINGTWQESGEYYPSYDTVNYVKSTLDLHMNWNNMVSYYMIAIIFGLVDSMAKNLTLRSWTKSSQGDNIWYMCFYDMDTALRVNNVGAETVPYNAHLHRYYTDNTSIAEARVTNHCPSISGVFNQEYSGYNTRLQEIVENCPTGSDDVKTLQSVYRDLRTNLFPDPEAFIDQYYVGQINKVGAALYNYDYYIKYLQTEKSYNPATGKYGENTYNYSEISYLHGNGSANVKDWFVKRIKFLDGVYGLGPNGSNGITAIDNTPLASRWLDNNATYITNVSPTSVQLTLAAESQIRITFATSGQSSSFWINETPTNYRINNVGARQVVTIYSNTYLTLLGNFNQFTWDTIGSLTFPLIKELSLRNQSNIKNDNFLVNASNLESLVKLDLHGVTLLDSSSNIVYRPLNIALQLPNLEELDVSDSSFNEVPLSSSSVLRKLNLSNTKIKTLNYSDLAMLEELIINGCNELETIYLSNCPKLKSLYIPLSVKTVFIGNCPGILSLVATYTGNSLRISNLTSVIIAACPGLKDVDFSNLNNLELEINLVGASNLENVNMSRVVTTNITFPAKNSWNTLKSIDLSYTSIEYINYDNTYPLDTDCLDLQHFTNLQSIMLTFNLQVKGLKCPNILDNQIELYDDAFYNCTYLKYIYGNFIIKGIRVFMDCTSLTLNSDSIYNNYAVLLYPVPFIDNSEACNISYDPYLNSTEELFNRCMSLSGNDFTMLMLKMHSNMSSLNKMFLSCANVDAEIKYDLFRHCPNVTNINSFAEGTSITGGIYSRSANYNENDTTTYGTFDFLPNLKLASNAFSNTSIQFIDNDIFAPIDDNYIGLMEADYMFSSCRNLESYQLANRESLIPNGRLKSKTFFTNLRNLALPPKGMFSGCSKVDMDIEREEVDGIVFDYLFHWPSEINMKTIDSSLYQGINLIGEIHDNVFGGRISTDGEYYIMKYTVINAPFELSGGHINCDLSNMGSMFSNVKDTLLQAKYVFRGINITNSSIPNDIFSGCTVLNSISGFFSNDTITNNGSIYTFPQYEMFKDCTGLKDISYLFNNNHNLSILLVGGGFKNCQLVNVNGLLRGTGVFGLIPYKFFYMERDGLIQQTIENITAVFLNCFKLGYTNDRSLTIGETYTKYNEEFQTTWEDAVIRNPGTAVPFELTFTNFDGNDPWYIDGRDWASIDSSLTNSPYYLDLYDNVFVYDNLQAQALSDSRDREIGYQNYMFPADYLRYCSKESTLYMAFLGLTYKTNILVEKDDGTLVMQEGETDGLTGRLPCKLFEALTESEEFNNVFYGLNFCAFINFNSYKFNTERLSASQCRGIKYPTDLFKNNLSLKKLISVFGNTRIETGVDINSDLIANNTNLISISGLFKDVEFNSQDYLDSGIGSNSQIDFSIFKTCSELQDVSLLFEVTDLKSSNKGLRIIESRLFDPVGIEDISNPRITNISSMFANNKLMIGSIPLFDTTKFTRIRSVGGYLAGVNKSLINNADAFISMHDTSWYPLSWIEENE